MKKTSRLSANLLRSLLLGPLLALIALPACAELEWSGTYTGVMFSDSQDKYKADDGSTITVKRGHLKAKYGWILNDYVSIEAQLGTTTNISSNKGIVTYGGYARVGQHFDQYMLYGLLGFTGLEDLDNASNVSEVDGSFGVGLEVFGTKDIAITFEYLHMLDKSITGGDLSFSTLGFGLTYYFTEDTSYFNKNRNKIDSIRY